mgnify:CR=1 FL=1
MEKGKNRPKGTDAATNRFMNWLAGSVGAIMFFNTKSAVLQTISLLNYINYTDNNPIQAAKAFANQKQYWTDFAYILLKLRIVLLLHQEEQHFIEIE